MFNSNNEDQVNNSNNIFLSDVVNSLVMEDEDINDNVKLHILINDM